MSTDRLRWADVARGGAMMLVVLAHVLQLMGVHGWTLGWLDTLNLYLTALRMPLFFLVSGVFAATAIGRSWGGLFRTRLALLIYMYVLWMLLRAIWFTFVPWPLSETAPWPAFALLAFWPTNGLWFLYALVLYLLVARATRSWRSWIVLAGAAVISVLAAYDLVPTGGNGVWRSVALYFFFFMLGVRLPRVWRTVAARANVWLLIAAVVAVPAGIVLFTTLPDALEGIGRVILSIMCVTACVVAAAMLARVPFVSTPFVAVGRRTLPIYVTHAMLLAVLVPLVPAGVVPAWVAAGVFTAIAIALCLGLYALLGPLGGVYNLPKPLSRVLSRERDRSG